MVQPGKIREIQTINFQIMQDHVKTVTDFVCCFNLVLRESTLVSARVCVLKTVSEYR